MTKKMFLKILSMTMMMMKRKKLLPQEIKLPDPETKLQLVQAMTVSYDCLTIELIFE